MDLGAVGTMIPERDRMEVMPVSVSDYYGRHVDVWTASQEHATEQELPQLDYRRVGPCARNNICYGKRMKFGAKPSPHTPL